MPARPFDEAYANAVSELRQRLLADEWGPGERLPAERQLATDFGVSRATIRQVLRELAFSGLLEIRPKVGIFARPVNGMTNDGSSRPTADGSGDRRRAARIAECIEARRILECGSLELVIENVAGADLSDLESLMERSKAAATDAEAIELDRAFHMGLHDLARNAIIRQAIGNSFDLLWESLPHVLAAPGRRTASWQHHRAILDAVMDKDLAAATGAMSLHLDMLRSALVDPPG